MLRRLRILPSFESARPILAKVKRIAATSLMLGTTLLGTNLMAGDADWAQWRGPARDGKAAEQSLLQSWPEGGPKLKWTFSTAGRGYSSTAIVDGKLFSMGSDEQTCYAICVDAKSGQSIWQVPISRAGTDDDYNTGWGGGPRGTPTIDGNQVFVLSDVGVLSALRLQDGKKLWSVDLVAEYGGRIPKWGYSESVLIDGDRVVVQPGGSNYMIALNRRTGKLLWQSKGVDAPAHYVSVMKGSLGGTNYYVTASNIGVVAFDCESGDKLFENSLSGNDVATIPTPLILGDLIYHTSDYGSGNVLLKLTSASSGINAEQVYHLDGKTMRNHHGGVVAVDGTIYGMSKVDGGVWMAQDIESGDTLWREKVGRNKSGSICFADGRLYCYNDGDGTVVLVEPNAERWSPLGMLTIPRETDLPRDRGAIWAHPVVADQTLFIRDQNLIFAFDIAR
ncbi:PQQ-binding-like beta-propeller repeat protein [Rhodopirellula bahusiensis]|uniref:Polyvinylalcohol dehydrogenase n=1 Tax=Rhodopirellula bahusiensis TaxID=2014065 RepID=A0A2G1VZN5_9BACT|nr:PQQ-binding-like beta-propeller repeat protein [Rhodopirellula bahusiensis]PHQ32191.1 polyvinylalcohol dehydrogenase [Rhodopirellula bahusiensis]